MTTVVLNGIQQLTSSVVSRAGIIQTQASTAIPTLTGTPYAGPGLGGNLVQNGDFSNGSVGWTLNAADTVHTSPADAPPGSSTCLKRVSSGALDASTQTLPVLPNTAYAPGGYLKGDGTNGIQVGVTWLNSAGTAIGTELLTTIVTAAAWTLSSGTATSPGNATQARLSLKTTAASTYYAGRLGLVAGATYADSQFSSNPLGNKSLVAVEATTNLLPDGDCEGVGGTSTVSLFNDTFVNANTWTTVSGSAPTVSGNVLTVPSGSYITAGHPDWWDTQVSGGTSGSQIRFQPQTGFTAINFFISFADTNDLIEVNIAPTTVNLNKDIAGTFTNLSSQTYTVTVGTTYWLTWSIAGSYGTRSATVTITADGAAPGAALTTLTGSWIDAGIQAGKIGVQAVGAAVLLGQMNSAAYSGVCKVTGPVPNHYNYTVTGDTSAYTTCALCWDRASQFNGTYSLSVALPNTTSSPVDGFFGTSGGTEPQAVAVFAATAYSFSCRAKTTGLTSGATVGMRVIEWTGGGAVAIDHGVVGTALTTNSDWVPLTYTVTTSSTTAYVSVRYSVTAASLTGSGIAWFDTCGIEAKAYATLCLDPFPAFFVPTGARAAAYASVATPVGMTASWTVALTAIPRIAQTVTPSQILWTDAAANYHIYFNYSGIRAGFAGVGAPAAAYTVGNAYRIVLVFSQGVGQLYVNGVSTGAAQVAQPILPSSTFLIGSDGAGATLDGNISGLVIASRAWSAAEVASDYANLNPPGLISGSGLYLQPGMLYAQTPDASANSLALPTPVGGREYIDAAHAGIVRTGNIQPLPGQSIVGIQGASFDNNGLLQAGGFKVLTGIAGTSSTAIAHGLGRIPRIVIPICNQATPVTVTQSTVADSTNCYITAASASTAIIILVA